jgi:hypothetical protein
MEDAMASYHVEWSHTPEECQRLIEETKDKSSHMLDKFYWDCESEPHKGYAILEGGSEEEVRKMIPPSMHSKVKFHEVKKISSWDMGKGKKEGFYNREDFGKKSA